MVNAGATWLDEEVVRDGNLVTSRGPQDLIPFIRAMKRLFAEPHPLRRERIETRPSDPQKDEPPQLMLSAMKWMPRPSLRTALGLGAVALAFVASARKGRPRVSTPPARDLEKAVIG
jgi:protease I